MAGTVAAIVAVLAAWPQDLFLPEADHRMHPMLDVPEDRLPPSMRLRVFPDGMDGFNVVLETRNFLFTPGRVGTEAVANEGHAHLYVNGEKVARLYSPWHHLPSGLLTEGFNRIEVEFSTNDHSVWSVAGEPIGAHVLIDSLVSDSDPIVRGAVSYTLDWRWGSASRLPGGGWEARNDLGFIVRVSAGGLISRNLELVPCHSIPPPAPRTALSRWLRPPVAEAGHSSLVPNESKISKSYEENLRDPTSLFLERRTVTDPEYCKAHYLVARAKGAGLGAAALHVSGTWSRHGGDEWKPFEIRSSSAYGEFLELSSAEGDILPRRSIVSPLDLSVSRNLGAMFDGIDFASGPSPETMGARVMRTLVSDTKVLVGGS